MSAAELVCQPKQEKGLQAAAPVFFILGPDRPAVREAAKESGGRCMRFSDIGEALGAIDKAAGAPCVLIVDNSEGWYTDQPDNLEKIASQLVSVLITTLEAQFDAGMRKAFFITFHSPADCGSLGAALAGAFNEAKRRAAAERDHRRLLGVLQCAETAKFVFRTKAEAEALARLLSFAFPDPAKAERGLFELLCNAVEHGSLDIGFKEKSRLLEDGKLDAEIERRLADPHFASRRAEAILARKSEGVYVVIKDEGAGFDWREFVKFSPARASHQNGRGIQVARIACFDKLGFNETGNQVSVFCKAPNA